MIYEQPHHTKHKHGQQNQTLFCVTKPRETKSPTCKTDKRQ